MKRVFKLIIMIAIINVLLIFTGCGAENNSKNEETEPTAAALSPSPTKLEATPAPVPTPTATPAPIQKTPSPAPSSASKVTKTVPILYYHAVNDTIEGMDELFVSPAEFEKQMNFLKQNNYTVITFDDIVNAGNWEKPVIITFDDGYEDNYTYAYPILKKYGFRATIFLVSDFIGNPSILNKNQIIEMGDLINFQGHSISHPNLTELSAEGLEKELSESKKAIEGVTGKPVTVFAYPTGYYNSQVLNVTKKYYNYAVCNGGGLYKTTDNPYEVKRVYVPRWLDIKGFEKKIQGLQ